MSAPFTLPDLPYSYDALEPHIDARTMEIHHGKHHQTYVNNLNAAIEKAPELGGRSLDELLAGISSVPEAVRTAVRNNGGGHWNHSLFWQLMTPATGAHASGPHAEGAEHAPNVGSAAAGALDEAMRASFGTYVTLRE
jgi:Fe-Mn family superoxide dismutase